MGLTLVRKHSVEAKRRKRNPKVALVLAGGAMTGGAFKVGGLKALDDFFVDRTVTDFDLYVGLSAGAVLATPLSAGVPPDEMIRVLEGTSEHFKRLGASHFYHPNWFEPFERPTRFAFELASYMPRISRDFVRGLPDLPGAIASPFSKWARSPSFAHLSELVEKTIEHTSPSQSLPNPNRLIPSGLFDNAPIERWLARGIRELGLENDFDSLARARGNALYISACNLDTAERVIFGAGENTDLSISQAVQASTALPGFYKPARIAGTDWIDGGIRHTANIDVAIEQGADLIVCYNPFRPFMNDVATQELLAEQGFPAIVNQVFRTLLQSRLELGIARYRADESFRGDIVLLEPQETHADFFAMNPLAFWDRFNAMRHGYESVRQTLLENFEPLRSVFDHYGIGMDAEAAESRAETIREERGWDAEGRTIGKRRNRRLRLVGT